MNILETTKEIQSLFEEYELCTLQASRVRSLAAKLENRTVTIAVIGQFKRGKTTTVNSILGKKLLPTGIIPITAAITRIEYGEGNCDETAKVYFQNGLCREIPVTEIDRYISEQENKENELGVEEVVLKTDSGFLKDGLVLVDTPGVGSVHEKNSKSAYDFARESDSVIFMLSVDSPVNSIEVDFLKSVKKYAGKFYFVVNKVDTVDEDDLKEYMEYCSILLSDIMGYDRNRLNIIPISARKNTGVEVLTEAIRNDLLNKGREIMEQSVELKLLEILKTTRSQISSYREVLKMPPNVFRRRFEEMTEMLSERRAKAAEIADRQESEKFLQAGLNEEKNYLVNRTRELFGIEYYYDVDRSSATEIMSGAEFARALTETYDSLEETLNSVFMYKEENAFTVARRIEDLNILVRSIEKYKRSIEKEI